MKYCAHCGAELEDGAAVCPRCGAACREISGVPPMLEDRSEAGLNVLSFLAPLVGLILYLIYRGSMPCRARGIKKAGLLGLGLSRLAAPASAGTGEPVPSGGSGGGTSASALHGDFILRVVEVTVFHYLETRGFFEELVALFCHFQDAVVFHVLAQVAGYDGLAQDSVPELFTLVLSAAEEFELVVLVGGDFFCLFSLQYVADVIVGEVLLASKDDFERVA